MGAVGVTHSESMQAPHMCFGRKQNVKLSHVVGRAEIGLGIMSYKWKHTE